MKQTPDTFRPSPSELRQRPFATSPAPEQCRVDLCTAQAEWMRTLYPEAPQPVFSSMALVNGATARGAQRLRPGFSFTESMDLAWALGFPSIDFIVDGVPVPDSFAATRDFYRVGERRALGHGINQWANAQLEHGRIFTRRAAVARIVELSPYGEDVTEEEKGDYAANVFELPDEDAEDYTADSNVSDFHLRAALIAADQHFKSLSEDVPLLTALAGPWRVADMLLNILEDGKAALAPSKIFFLLTRLGLQLTEVEFSTVAGRARAWAKAHGEHAESSEARWLDDAVAYAQETLQKEGQLGRVRGFVLGVPSELLRSELAERLIPSSNDVFLADPAAVLRATTSEHYEAADVERWYFTALSSVASAEVLVPLLEFGHAEAARALMSPWFDVRAAWAAPHLEDAKSKVRAPVDREKLMKQAWAEFEKADPIISEVVGDEEKLREALEALVLGLQKLELDAGVPRREAWPKGTWSCLNVLWPEYEFACSDDEDGENVARLSRALESIEYGNNR